MTLISLWVSYGVMKEQDGVPEVVPVLPRTKSNDLTCKMYMTDHRLVKMDGPPDFEDEPDTEVDGVIDTIVYDVDDLGKTLIQNG